MVEQQPSKTTLYLAIACGVLVLILIVVALIVYTGGGNPAVPASAAAASAAAAAEAMRRRTVARQDVGQAKTDLDQQIGEIKDNHQSTNQAAEKVPGEVAKMTDERLKAEGERLFGGGDK